MNGSAQASGRSGRQPSRRLPKHAVLVDAGDGSDGNALGALQLGEGMVQIGPGHALLDEQGLGLGTVRRVEPIAPARGCFDHRRLRGASRRCPLGSWRTNKACSGTNLASTLYEDTGARALQV